MVDQNQLSIFQLMKQKMRYASHRQAVLTQNIANADTPNYQAMDVKTPNFRRLVDNITTSGKRVDIALTHPDHMVLGDNVGSGGKKVSDYGVFEKTKMQNTITLDEQILKVTETAGDHAMTTSLYRKMNELMRLASGNNGGN